MLDVKKLLTKMLQNHYNLVKAHQNGTTDGNGNLAITGETGVLIILFAWDGSHIFIPFFYSNNWYLKVCSTNSSLTNLVNAAISCDYYYVKAH